MSHRWNFLKAFSLKPTPSDPNDTHSPQFVTASDFPQTGGGIKRGIDTSVQNLPSDAFGRLRVSNLTTLFDSKQIHDNQPLFWDDQEVSGSGTSSTYNTNQASTTLAVSNLTAGKRVRQTYQRFNYQPGKSQLLVFTGVLGNAASGITAEIGQMDDQNGLFFRSKDGVLYVVQRSYVSGAAVDTPIAQSAWNLDTLDGNGPSGITLEPTKTQIGFIDYEWLGVGRVRFGFYVNGVPIYCHEFLNTNNLTTVYMSTPNLPLRYSIENDGTGPAASLVHICSSVQSEGGQNILGTLRHKDSGTVGSLASGTIYALLGIRLKSTHLGINIFIENLSSIATSSNDKAHWELRFNPTVAGTFTYTDETNSAVQTATGATTNTVTGGIEIDGGYFTDSVQARAEVANALKLGASIAGVRDTMVLCVRPVTNNITVESSMTWRELS